MKINNLFSLTTTCNNQPKMTLYEDNHIGRKSILPNKMLKQHMDKRLVDFLQTREVNKNEQFTHTSKIKPCRRYYIDGDDLDEFYNVYNQVIEEGGMAGITEKPTTVVPLIVDIDFRCSLDNGVKRYYKASHIKDIIQVYQEVIQEIVDQPTDKMLMCAVLEKTAPTVFEGSCKDGFHLHFPHFYSEHWVQKDYIRQEVIQRVTERKILSDVPMLQSLDKVFDRNIPNVTWLMYGSRKDINSESYKISRFYNKNLDTIPIKTIFKRSYSIGTRTWNLPKYLSIRQGVEPTLLKEDVVVKKSAPRRRRREFQRDLDTILSELIIADQLLPMINNERADDYGQWMEIGWILFNISEGHDKGLTLWIDFSKRSEKFEEGGCEKIWDKMERRGYSLATLKYLARNDSPNEFVAWNSERVDHLLQQGISMAHNDIAKILYLMYENKYVCADVEKEVWYEFGSHRWIRNPKGISLRQHLSHELTNKYAKLAAKYYTQLQTEEDQERKLMYNSKAALISKLIERLKNSTFKNSVMKEAMEYFYDKDFVEKMDENPYLLVCENGVYDSLNKVFRDGRPDDYCTKSTGLYYTHFDPDDPRIAKLHEIFKKTFVNSKLRKFFRQTASDLIRGGNRHKIFVIWTGDGDNGKSVLADLLEIAFGEYYYTPPTTMLTGKQQQSSGATADLLPCKGARVVVISETDNKDVLNCGAMKKFTGGDPFYARGLFKEPTKITPQFKLILHCNKLPDVSAEDKASWNRIRVLPYESKFVKADNGLPETEVEQWDKKIFPMDKTLKEQLPDLAEAFLWLLIQDYEKFDNADLYQPEEVTGATDIYRKTNDFYLQFADERLLRTDNSKDYLTLTMLYELFKAWYKEAYPGRQIPTRMMVSTAMEKKLGPLKKGVWRNVVTFDPEEVARQENVDQSCTEVQPRLAKPQTESTN